jgi:death-on-curing protein
MSEVKALEIYAALCRENRNSQLNSSALYRTKLESALEFIKHDIYYPELADKLNHLISVVTDGHCFNDGNKQASIEIGSHFLAINSREYLVANFKKYMVDALLWLAAGLITREELLVIVRELINEGDLSNSTKLTFNQLNQQYLKSIEGTGLNLQ